MVKYRIYEKVKDKYVIQNIETKGLELVDEKDIIEGKSLGLAEDYNLLSDITRKRLVGDEIIFETDCYKIVYNKEYQLFDLNVFDAKVKNRNGILLYVPEFINNIEMGNQLELSYIVVIAYGLKNLTIRLSCRVLDLVYLNFSNITTMEDMFRDSYIYKIRFDDKIDTSNVINMDNMFSGCEYLEDLDLSSFNTENVTSMRYLFSGCNRIKDINLSNFNTKNVISMDGMFQDCWSLEYLDLSSFDTNQVLVMSAMFKNAKNLKYIKFGKNFKSTRLYDITAMFFNCRRLKELDLSTMSFNRIEYNYRVFERCVALEKLDLSNAEIPKEAIKSFTWFLYTENIKKLIIKRSLYSSIITHFSDNNTVIEVV